MVIKGSKLYSADNSGAQILTCIDVLKKNNSVAIIGSTLLLSVKLFVHTKKLKKKILYFGLLVTTRQLTYRVDGSAIKFGRNRVLIFSRQFKFLGTRIYGSISKDIRLKLSLGVLDKKKYHKALSYASSVV